MSIIDNLKNAAGFTDNTKTGPEDSGKGPSEILKKALSLGASTILQASKTFANTLVSNYHPPITYHFFTDLEDIRRLIDSNRRFMLINNVQLAELCSNNLETLKWSPIYIKSDEDYYLSKLRESESQLAVENQRALKGRLINAKSLGDNLIVEKLNQDILAAKLSIENLLNSETSLKVSILIKMRSKENFQDILSKLNKKHPDWLHPLLAKSLLKYFPDPDIRLVYLKKALRCDPTNKELLKEIVALKKDKHSRIYLQLQSLIK